MGGGWRGPLATAGGIGRTWGLQRRFGEGGPEGPLPPVTRAGLRRIGRYFFPYWRQWVVIFGCVALAAGLSVLPPFCVEQIIDRAIPNGSGRLVGLLAGAMVGLAVAGGLLDVLQQTLTFHVGQNIMFDLRAHLYSRLQRMSLGFYTATRSGEIVSRINNDVNAIQGVATGTLVAIATNLATLAATSAALFTRNWRLALLAILVVPAFYLPSKVVGQIRRRLSAATQESQAALLVFLTERLHVGGSILMSIFGQRDADARTFSEKSQRVRDLNVRQAVVGRWLRMILVVFSAVGPALVFWYGGLQAIRGEVKPGLLVAFAALLTLLYRPLMQLSSIYVDIQGSFAVFERIFAYLDLKPEIEDKPDALPVPEVKGHVVFKGVGFSYPRLIHAPVRGNGDVSETEAPKPFALSEVTFEILPGEQVALVGPSGAGKTTVTYLVPRFYDPSAGCILLDGRDLRDLAQEDLRRHIGMVTQETFLFHATIRENLLYAKPQAREEEVVRACQAANIHDFIVGLPDGYDTLVGERGFRLSGGEKQRVSIARAILKDPAILILDEATSSLDATSEYLIQTALETLLRNRTSLIIAHRLSTILSSDKIVVMNAGRVVEIGSHTELLQREGLYAALFEQQFAKVLDMRNEQDG
jgi:ATP-binding cassette subfamily B protein